MWDLLIIWSQEYRKMVFGRYTVTVINATKIKPFRTETGNNFFQFDKDIHCIGNKKMVVTTYIHSREWFSDWQRWLPSFFYQDERDQWFLTFYQGFAKCRVVLYFAAWSRVFATTRLLLMQKSMRESPRLFLSPRPCFPMETFSCSWW